MRSRNVAVIGLVWIASCADNASNGQAQVVSTGGGPGVGGMATGGRAQTGGRPSGGGGASGAPDTGGVRSCGGAIGLTCGPVGAAEFRMAIGTDVQASGVKVVRMCRNQACAAVDISEGVATPGTMAVAFGPGDSERVQIGVSKNAGATFLTVTWLRTRLNEPIEDGDVYSLRLLDASGGTIEFLKRSATYRRFTRGGPSSCGDNTVRCLDVTLTDVSPDAADGAADAGPEGGVTADGGPARCCPADQGALSSLDAGVDGWRCVALGGADLGGCYKTCAWSCPDTHVVARLGRDTRGCEMWVPEPAGAKPPFCLPYR